MWDACHRGLDLESDEPFHVERPEGGRVRVDLDLLVGGVGGRGGRVPGAIGGDGKRDGDDGPAEADRSVELTIDHEGFRGFLTASCPLGM